jgi:hypothetical protein
MTTSNKNLISRTLARHMMAKIQEYELIKLKKSTKFKTVQEFCQFNQFSRQNFMKIYHRYKANPCEESLIPQKRGPKYKTRRIDINVENEIIALRKKGNNIYSIRRILINSKFNIVPCPATIYNICKRHNLSKLSKINNNNNNSDEPKNRYQMKKIGELVHIDLHQLQKGITIENAEKTYYVLGIIDDLSRIAWFELLPNKQAITVMFATLRAFNILKIKYDIDIKAVMSDNGAEFGSGKFANNKDTHPFEVLLKEMEMKHVYTRPYRPQTNGKIERIWRTLDEDFLEDALYNNEEDLKEELLQYNFYYNEYRPHSSLSGKTPLEFLNSKKYDN